jgi:hypothetical protein
MAEWNLTEITGEQPTRDEDSSDEDAMVHGMPLGFSGESQGGTTITPAVKAPERLRPESNLTPGASLARITSPKADPSWQLPASTAPPSWISQETPKRGRLGIGKAERMGIPLLYASASPGNSYSDIENSWALSYDLRCVHITLVDGRSYLSRVIPEIFHFESFHSRSFALKSSASKSIALKLLSFLP